MNNKCSIISETVQAMPMKFAMEIVRLKVCKQKIMTIVNPMTDVASHKVTTASETWEFLTRTIGLGLIVIFGHLSYGHLNCAAHGDRHVWAHARFDDRYLDLKTFKVRLTSFLFATSVNPTLNEINNILVTTSVNPTLSEINNILVTTSVNPTLN